ncbi:hypothetical protein ADL03_02625 [Nocardia sp. NRRL S-836]|nr:hypothetical protein ADL03_02625 [Nocardia sp. NRRL S-836]
MLTDFVIKNIGQSSALDVRVSMDPAPERTMEKGEREKFADLRMLKEPIQTFAPGREIRAFFDSMIDRLNSDLPMVYTVTVTYGMPDSEQRWEESHVLDLNVQNGSEQVTAYGLHDAAKALREIGDLLKRSDVLRGPIAVIAEDREVHIRRLQNEREARLQQRVQRMAETAAEAQRHDEVDGTEGNVDESDEPDGEEPPGVGASSPEPVRGESVDGGKQGQIPADGD